jgi:hypothetical protein
MNDDCASPRSDCRKTQQGQVNPTASKTTRISQTQNTIARKKEGKREQQHDVILEKKRKKEKKKKRKKEIIENLQRNL